MLLKLVHEPPVVDLRFRKASQVSKMHISGNVRSKPLLENLVESPK